MFRYQSILASSQICRKLSANERGTNLIMYDYNKVVRKHATKFTVERRRLAAAAEDMLDCRFTREIRADD
jgi:hypothetical protein